MVRGSGGASLPTTLTLAPVTESVPAARRFVREALAALEAPAACDDALALVSELATNAVLHARTPYTIVVTRDGDTVRVSVRDHSAVVPRRRTYGLDATTGRGLRLVATIASDWGVDAEGTGKVVWFELPRAGTRTPQTWYANVDVEALLGAFDDGDRDRPSPQLQS